MNSLSLCHKFSIGFKSGDSAGVFHQLIPLLVMKSRAKMEVCLGSLSCMKQWGVVEKLTRINGINVWSRMEVNRNLSMIPSKIQIPVRPFLEIPVQTWTFTGCFGLLEQQKMLVNFHNNFIIVIHCTYRGFGLGACPFFRQQKCQRASSQIVDSSVQITSLKSSSLYCLHQSEHFALFSSRIS